MKKAFAIFLCLFLCFLLPAPRGSREAPAPIAATTMPVWDFTVRLCAGTGLEVTRLVTEEVSCLHDYSLNVSQVKAAESAETIVISGAGLEDFMLELLAGRSTIDASAGIELLTPEEHHHEGEEDHQGHRHEEDPHIWLSPANARAMAENICAGLTARYPVQEEIFARNLQALVQEVEALEAWGQAQLASLSCRELITFHDGFAYLADAFDLTILEAMEEESGSEASARDLIRIIEEVERHSLPAVFTEKSGSVSAAGIIARETGAKEYSLDMAMAGSSWFDAMYHNIRTLKEALQ